MHPPYPHNGEQSGMRILIVDDERLVRFSLRSMLEESGPGRFEVVEASNGAEMIRSFEEVVPDVALVDIKMPGMDGLTAIETIDEEQRKRTAWVILTAQQTFDAAQRAIRLGASDYLLKPVDPDSLLRVVENLEEQLMPVAPAGELATDNPLVQRAAQWSAEHLRESIGLAQAAEAVGVSANYLSTVFHQHAGLTFTQYLTRLRMEEARRLLREQGGTVRAVAERVGYQSHRHFARRYHAHFGHYPSEERLSE